MSEIVVIFATVVAKPDCADEVLSLLQGMIEPSRKEEGCVIYDLHKDLENSNVFIFHEAWLSADHLDAHFKTPHFTALDAKLGDLTESVVIKRTTKL